MQEVNVQSGSLFGAARAIDIFPGLALEGQYLYTYN
jgi:hypothetical protein